MNKVKERIREDFNIEVVHDNKSFRILIIFCDNQIKTDFS